MASGRTEGRAGNSRRIQAEAARWLARRAGPGWRAADQAALEAWLARDTAHRVAFLRLDSVWQEAGRLRALAAGTADRGPPPRRRANAVPPAEASAPASAPRPDFAALRFAPRPRATPARRWPWLAMASLGVAAAVAGGLAWQRDTRVARADYASAMGQLRQVTLADGSQATLSSGTRIEVALRRGRRDIALDAGEAVFHAAKDPDRPFVVSAGGRQVTAVGTVFAVRRDAGERLQVVVTEGTVRLDAPPQADGRPGPSTLLPAGSIAQAGPHGVLVRSVPLDQARQALDWQRGLLRLDDVPLAEAVAEFNRYNTRKLVVGDAAAGALRVGGSFQWANTEGFVRLLERGFPVRAERGPDQVVLHSR